MDGASYWQIFRKVMLPLSIPAITTIAVLQFIQIWDDLLVGLLFLQTPETSARSRSAWRRSRPAAWSTSRPSWPARC